MLESGVVRASDINPDIQYNAAPDGDPYAMKKKVVRGGFMKV